MGARWAPVLPFLFRAGGALDGLGALAIGSAGGAALGAGGALGPKTPVKSHS